MRCLLFLILGLACLSHKSFAQESDQQKAEYFLNHKDYFQLNDLLKRKHELNKPMELYFKAEVATAFLSEEESQVYIDSVFNQHPNNFPDSLGKCLYELKLLNEIRLGKYSAALQTTRSLLRDYSLFLSKDEQEEYADAQLIWQALVTTSPQEVLMDEDKDIELKRDLAGLLTIPVQKSAVQSDFVFDTGANFSVITRTNAEKMGITIIPAQFSVGSATGIVVKSDVGVADSLFVGGVLVRNVVFLVFEDQDLSFPSSNYYIQGIIGFPVIRGFQEIQLSATNHLLLKKNPSTNGTGNMAMNDLLPIVQLTEEGTKLVLSFDSGAAETCFYPSYKTKHPSIKKWKKSKFKTGSAGGIKTVKGNLLSETNLTLGDATAQLKNIQIYNKVFSENSAILDGNLGQDFMHQFNELIINFTTHSISVRGKVE